MYFRPMIFFTRECRRRQPFANGTAFFGRRFCRFDVFFLSIRFLARKVQRRNKSVSLVSTCFTFGHSLYLSLLLIYEQKSTKSLKNNFHLFSNCEFSESELFSLQHGDILKSKESFNNSETCFDFTQAVNINNSNRTLHLFCLNQEQQQKQTLDIINVLNIFEKNEFEVFHALQVSSCSFSLI